MLPVERFDRVSGTEQRRMVVSALTILGVDEVFARYATYPDLAEVVRATFTAPAATPRELFCRIVSNICISNTDDHARNHAAFWDGRQLTPAYDLCPSPRSGEGASHAMAISPTGESASQFRVALEAAPVFHLDRSEAADIVDHQVSTIHEQWDDAADVAQLTVLERQHLWGRQVLNPFASYGYQ